MIAQVASWSGVAEWTKEAGQKSAPVSLVAGQKYYLEGLMKEGGGGDSLDVGWAGPGIGDATCRPCRPVLQRVCPYPGAHASWPRVRSPPTAPSM